MLRRVEKARIYSRQKHRVFRANEEWMIFSVGKAVFRVATPQYEVMAQIQKQRPSKLGSSQERTYWWYQEKFYWENEELAEDGGYALLVTTEQRRRQSIDRAKATVVIQDETRPFRRTVIPDALKQHVWVRDAGRCQVCGASNELQFDHIIPISLGGATAEDNLQILCGPCNRRKGSGLTC